MPAFDLLAESRTFTPLCLRAEDFLGLIGGTSRLVEGQRAYSFSRRVRPLTALPIAQRPTASAFRLAVMLDAYVGECARTPGVADPVTVLSYVEGGTLLIEWNIQGRNVRHFECLISGQEGDRFPVLHSIEDLNGEILRMTEIPRADLAEVLAELVLFLERPTGRSRE